MSLLMDETNVSLNEQFNDLLEDLQPGILKHHGRQFAHHLFMQFNDTAAARLWIAESLCPRIITAKKQLQDVQSRHIDPKFDGGSIVVFALSASGYKKLGITDDKLPDDTAFRTGMKGRATQIGDSPEQENWDSELTREIDALIIVADSSRDAVETLVQRMLTEISHFNAGAIHFIQKGSILRNYHGIGIEHFGYADGVSQPLFLRDEIQQPQNSGMQDDSAPLSLLLVKDPGGANADSYGSYLVFRKLEQNVRGFKENEERLSGKFNLHQGVLNKFGHVNHELAGAMLIGRFENGTPVITNSEEVTIIHEEQLNNAFSYASDTGGSKCPFHAHIRITNPRSTPPIEGKKDFKRIIRRGIPYNDIGRNERDLENDQPSFGVGLLFMCYQASIERQFEFIQNAANKKLDAVIGQIPVTQITLPLQWGRAPTQSVDLTDRPFNFVTHKGGEYFFTPSISFLNSF